MKIEFDSAAFSKAVKMKRGESGVGLEKLSAMIDVGASTIHRAERGRDCSIETFTKLCSWLAIQPGEFFKEAEK